MQSRDERLAEIERLFNKKAWHRLVSQVEKWQEDDPGLRDAVLWQLGWARLHGPEAARMGVVNQAAGELRQALKQNPQRSSRVEFERFSMLESRAPAGELEAYIALIKARLHGIAGKNKNAVKQAQAAIAKDPDCDEAHYWLGNYARSAEMFELACQAYATVIERHPDAWGLYYARIIALQNLDDHQGALADIDQIIRLNPDDEARWRAERAQTLHQMGRDKEARQDLQRSLDLDPENGVALAAMEKISKVPLPD